MSPLALAEYSLWYSIASVVSILHFRRRYISSNVLATVSGIRKCRKYVCLQRLRIRI